MTSFKKQLISEQQNLQIEAAILRLQHAVTPVQVVNWLNNFHTEDWDMALTVLNALSYYNIAQIISEYDDGLMKVLAAAGPEEKIYLHGYGELGKSGKTMLYFIRQTPAFKINKERIKILSDVEQLKKKKLKEGSWLVLLDDVIGSGMTLSTFYHANIGHHLTRYGFSINLCVICVAYMREAIPMLMTKIPNLRVFGTSHHKAFAQVGSVFGYRPNMLKIREFCYKYGIDLFSTYDYKTKSETKHPLGFNNSQSLIIFAHSAPNNTLPIIWSAKRSWIPLFPRSGEAKISEIKTFRSENNYWLSIGYKMKLLKLENEQLGMLTRNIDFGILALLRLKTQNSSPEKIFQFLGISVNEYEKLIELGQEKGFFDDEHRITKAGTEVYNSIQKKIKINYTEMSRKIINFNNEVSYVPKIFNGLT